MNRTLLIVKGSYTWGGKGWARARGSVIRWRSAVTKCGHASNSRFRCEGGFDEGHAGSLTLVECGGCGDGDGDGDGWWDRRWVYVCVGLCACLCVCVLTMSLEKAKRL